MKTAVQLNALIITELETALSQVIPSSPKVFLRILARVVASVFILLYKYVGFASLQMFAKTASWDEIEVNGFTVRPLLFWGDILGLGLPKGRVRAEYTTQIQVNNSSNDSPLPAGTQLLHNASQIIFSTLEEVDLSFPVKGTAFTVTASVRAFADTFGTGGGGTQGNIEDGSIMSIIDAPVNVEPDTTVLEQLVAGVDAETEAEYRGRVQDRFQQIPQGGAYADYKWWVLDVPGIIAAYPYTGVPGSMNVYVRADDDEPSIDQLLAVQDALDNGYRKPLTCRVFVHACTYIDYEAIVIDLLVDSSNLEEAEDRIEASIQSYGDNREPFIHGLSIPPRRDRLSTGEVTGEAASAGATIGATVEVVSLTRGGMPVQTDILGEGELANFSIVFPT